MRERFILIRYITREIIPNYLIGLGFLTSVILIGHLFYVIKISVEHGASVIKALALLVLYLPLILQITLPIAVVIAALLAIGRLSDDSEITAMRSCGVSLLKIFLPVVTFGVFISAFSLFFYEYIYPPGVKEYIKSKIEIYYENPTSELAKNNSYNTIDNISITVDRVDPKTQELQNVRINYNTEDRIIFAPKGMILSKDHKYNVFPLILYNSVSQPLNTTDVKKKKASFDEQFITQQTIYIPDQEYPSEIPGGHLLWSLTEFVQEIESKKAYYTMSTLDKMHSIAILKVNKIKIDQDYKDFNKQTKEAYTKSESYKKQQLKHRRARKKINIKIKRYIKQVQKSMLSNSTKDNIAYEEFLFNRKLCLTAMACAFAILGGPLGIFSKRAGKTFGLGISIIVILLFFVIVFVAESLFKQNILSSFTAGWLPALIIYPLGCILFALKLSGRDSIKDTIIEVYIRLNIFFKKVTNKTKILNNK